MAKVTFFIRITFIAVFDFSITVQVLIILWWTPINEYTISWVLSINILDAAATKINRRESCFDTSSWQHLCKLKYNHNITIKYLYHYEQEILDKLLESVFLLMSQSHCQESSAERGRTDNSCWIRGGSWSFWQILWIRIVYFSSVVLRQASTKVLKCSKLSCSQCE